MQYRDHLVAGLHRKTIPSGLVELIEALSERRLHQPIPHRDQGQKPRHRPRNVGVVPDQNFEGSRGFIVGTIPRRDGHFVFPRPQDRSRRRIIGQHDRPAAVIHRSRRRTFIAHRHLTSPVRQVDHVVRGHRDDGGRQIPGVDTDARRVVPRLRISRCRRNTGRILPLGLPRHLDGQRQHRLSTGSQVCHGQFDRSGPGNRPGRTRRRNQRAVSRKQVGQLHLLRQARPQILDRHDEGRLGSEAKGRRTSLRYLQVRGRSFRRNFNRNFHHRPTVRLGKHLGRRPREIGGTIPYTPVLFRRQMGSKSNNHRPVAGPRKPADGETDQQFPNAGRGGVGRGKAQLTDIIGREDSRRLDETWPRLGQLGIHRDRPSPRCLLVGRKCYSGQHRNTRDRAVHRRQIIHEAARTARGVIVANLQDMDRTGRVGGNEPERNHGAFRIVTGIRVDCRAPGPHAIFPSFQSVGPDGGPKLQGSHKRQGYGNGK